jgi:poly-gamma-glutamate synthesis protein (capsule biosynthesis protein)
LLLAFAACALLSVPAGCSGEYGVEDFRVPVRNSLIPAPQSPPQQEREGAESAAPRKNAPSEAALVPIAHLSSRSEDVGLQELADVRGLAVSEADAGPAGELLKGADLVALPSPEAVLRRVSRDPGSIGLVPWDAVDARVKALSVGGISPFDPLRRRGEYPLAGRGERLPDPETLRRVVVGGDVMLDRGVAYSAYQLGGGPRFPLRGGYAAITSHTPVPNPDVEGGVSHVFQAERRGGRGAVREYLRGADLALANLENPVLRDAVWHPDGVTFHGDLWLLPVLNGFGVDGVTLANNHILDAGPEGLAETVGHLDGAGIRHAGAGADLAAARKAMVFDLDGLAVGVLSYQNVPGYEWSWAGEDAPGTAPLKARVVREDVERLRREVDVVVVVPHWGREYTAEPEPGQVELACAAVGAGANLVVGHHAHWVKGMEVYRRAPVFYGTGNLVFDQDFSEETSVGVFAEATLVGERVVQARPVPFVILEKGQPNFLVPEAGGDRVLQEVFAASVGPEFDADGAP